MSRGENGKLQNNEEERGMRRGKERADKSEKRREGRDLERNSWERRNGKRMREERRRK